MGEFQTNAPKKCADCGYEGSGDLCLWCETPMTIIHDYEAQPYDEIFDS